MRIFWWIALLVGFIFLSYLAWPARIPPAPYAPTPLWPMRSIDTMKYSRDLAREKLNNPAFDETIELQVAAIASAGASHVAIATPYDPEFVPYLTRWVRAARAHHLGVWFRGNMSGWEEWFDYPPLTTEEHTEGVVKFVRDNPNLFENGDYLSSCPECENGHLGDPRLKWRVEDYRAFLVTEHKAVAEAFRIIDKNVNISLNSMNYDVATLVMNEDTTRALGGVVAIDHYIKDPLQLTLDIDKIAARSGGRVFLGEFGAPIPDLHGKLSEREQADWIRQALNSLSDNKSLIGINYWVNIGGSTALWNDNNSPRKAVGVITQFYTQLK